MELQDFEVIRYITLVTSHGQALKCNFSKSNPFHLKNNAMVTFFAMYISYNTITFFCYFKRKKL